MAYAPTISIRRSPAEGTGEIDRAKWHERASALYEELRRPATGLIRRAYGSTFDETEIEDIYSSAWLGTLRALERKHAELSDEDVRSYLLTAVANHASKEIRRQKRKPVAPLEAAGAVPEVADSLQDRAERTESTHLTRDLLSSLPPRRRAVMLLRYGWELEPGEICGMIDGLSPRAYRKEITKGVDDLVERIKLVEQGEWCQEREPVLKAFAAGIATDDQALQAERHISHCRSCHEFVGKLSGHLHDVGSSILLPAALECVDGHSSFLDKAKDAFDGARESAFGAATRTETSEGITAVTSTRGAGAVGAGVLAKLSGAGLGAKAVLTCAGGLVAASVCVVAVLGPTSSDGSAEAPTAAPSDVVTPAAEAIRHVPVDQVLAESNPEPQRSEGRDPSRGSDGGNARSSGDSPASEPPAPSQSPAPEPQPVLAPSTPPTTQEFGPEGAAQPAGGGPPPQTDPGSDEGAVAQEFGP
jgi:RNA polymerase sigma factor (sigma-70 family)